MILKGIHLKTQLEKEIPIVIKRDRNRAKQTRVHEGASEDIVLESLHDVRGTKDIGIDAMA